jgi:hypothetical protein
MIRNAQSTFLMPIFLLLLRFLAEFTAFFFAMLSGQK